MVMAKRFVIFGGIVSLLVSLALPAAAAGPASATTVSLLSNLGGRQVSDQILADMHGRDVPANPAQLGTVDNNSSSGTTGAINDYSSVTGNQGITTVIQNTGSNDLFQTSTIVNIQLNN